MKIAVTGGIAEGKSTVLSYVRQLGVQVDSADQMAKEIFSDPYIQRELAGVIGVDGPVVPDALKEALSARSELRRKVNNVMHPAILERIRSSVAVVIEVPLLIEVAMQGEFDRLWVVTCGKEEQRRRLLARLGDEVLTDRLIASQLNTRVKVAFADKVFRTNEDEDAVKRCVTEAVRRSI